ncbi:MAG: class I SAM-dependent methyltransferase, partial [Acidobacteria bacterium]|nr:class I SAM-dependent methyltransferase [Acidobacteriota bacterium]
ALWAAAYDEEANPLLALEERTLRPLLPDLQGKSALDLACGTGRWLGILLRRGAASVVGVDFCGPMLAQAASKPGIRGRLVRADCEALPFRSEAADLAICSFALGYLPTLAGFATGLAQIIRPGAQVFLSDLHPSAYERGWHRSFRTGTGVVEILSYCHSIERVCGELRAHGFEQLRIAEPDFGEPEREIFRARGKAHLFDEVIGKPAIWVAQFQRARNSVLD